MSHKFAAANEASRAFVDAELRDDPIIFPPNTALNNAEMILQLGPEGRKLQEEI